ncbi:isoprenylcysteine carboxylmethyltransferase family protein [Georgenia yuyongxinii]
MTTATAAALALGLYLAGLVAAFGVRTWVHRRRTGSSGFRGLTGSPGSAKWWGGFLVAAALLLGAAGPALALAGTLAPRAVPPVLAWAGLVVALAGFAGVLAAQAGMGAWWRIGVDATERTTLVTTGSSPWSATPFHRHALRAGGPSAAGSDGVERRGAGVCLLLASSLRSAGSRSPTCWPTHGQAYTTYATTVGRLLPGISRLSFIEKERVP